MTTRTASPATPQAMTGIPPPSGGLLAKIASFFAVTGAVTGGFEVEFADVGSGRCGSLISRDFIPAKSTRPPRRQPSGGIIGIAPGKTLQIFHKRPELPDARS